MSRVLRSLGLDSVTWDRVGPSSLWSATAIVVVASALMALNRFGGLVTDAPRPFLRLTLVGVWGWIGLAAGVSITLRRVPSRAPTTLRTTFAVVGLAHVPLLALAGVIFVAAVMFQLLGPGLAMAVIVLAIWFPALLIAGVRHTSHIAVGPAAAVIAAPYGAWLLVVGRHVVGQVEHLL